MTARVPPPPTPAADPQPSAVQVYRRERSPVERVLVAIAATIGAVVIVGGSVLFLFGQDLFGSDEGTIDSYNEEVLNSCDVPEGSTLVRTFVLDLESTSGQRFRSLSFVYASPSPAPSVTQFYGLPAEGLERRVSADRACMFDQRPSAVVVHSSTADDVLDVLSATLTDGSAEARENVVDVADVPANTQSFFRLRLAQLEEEGVFS
ncbi:MAG: hypothetical protein HKN94_04440 [Acidimicrobiales bacterium]|nr:hypothetical protein [Acidimicrobiales bacterium]RZV45194.1 MAG: hypothetical protein EX269_10470 [Acidimicrobiales bacterium]